VPSHAEVWRLRATSPWASGLRYALRSLALLAVFATPLLFAVSPVCGVMSTTDEQQLLALRALQLVVGITYTVGAMLVNAMVTLVVRRKNLELVSTRGLLKWHLRTFGFWADVCAIISCFAEVSLAAEPLRVGLDPSFRQWITLLDLLRAWRSWAPVSPLVSGRFMLLDIMGLAVLLVVVAHFFACFWILLGFLQQRHWGLDAWAGDRTCMEQYWASIYFSTYTLTSIGYGDIHGTNSVEYAVATVYMILGQMIVAKIFADLTWLTSLWNLARAQSVSRRAQVMSDLEQAKVPYELRQRILAFQDFCTVHYNGAHEHGDPGSSGLSALSPALSEELRLARYHRFLINVKYFQQQPISVLRRLVKAVHETTSLPGEFIIRWGDPGEAIYFVQSGVAAVYLQSEQPTWTSPSARAYTTGESFGEVGVLAGTPRTAWIMAKTYCTMAKVPADDLLSLLEFNPGSFLLLVKNLLECQDLTLPLKHPWSDLRASLEEMFESVEDAYEWFCDSSGVITLPTFEHCLKELGVPQGLELRIRWAEIDHACNGEVIFEQFEQQLGGWNRNPSTGVPRLSRMTVTSPRLLRGHGSTEFRHGSTEFSPQSQQRRSGRSSLSFGLSAAHPSRPTHAGGHTQEVGREVARRVDRIVERRLGDTCQLIEELHRRLLHADSMEGAPSIGAASRTSGRKSTIRSQMSVWTGIHQELDGEEDIVKFSFQA